MSLKNFYEAVTRFEGLSEANPWHDSATGEFGGDKGSWSLRCKRKRRCVNYGAQKKKDKKNMQRGNAPVCGSNARTAGGNVRCHDGKKIRPIPKGRRKGA